MLFSFLLAVCPISQLAPDLRVLSDVTECTTLHISLKVNFKKYIVLVFYSKLYVEFYSVSTQLIFNS